MRARGVSIEQYLLSMNQPGGDIPASAVLEKISEVRAVEEDMRAAGAWGFSGGLPAPSPATVLDPRSEAMVADRWTLRRGQGAVW